MATWARALRLSAFWLMAVATVFIGLFVVGETLSDPGGWAAAGLIALWAVPMAALCALAHWWPNTAVWVLGVVAAVLVAATVWFAADPGAWRTLENQRGPVRAIAVWVVAVAAAVLGLRQPRNAGVLLLLVGLAPLLIGGVRGGFGSLAAVALPTVVVGALYLLSAMLTPAPPVEGGAGRTEHARSGR